jgi:hypothetical protein
LTHPPSSTPRYDEAAHLLQTLSGFRVAHVGPSEIHAAFSIGTREFMLLFAVDSAVSQIVNVEIAPQVMDISDIEFRFKNSADIAFIAAEIRNRAERLSR